MAASRDSIEDIWGPRTPYEGEDAWPVRVDVRTSEEPERWVQSACVLCSNGCACDIGVKGGRIVGVRGRGVDRVNRGRLGPKGLHGWEANHSADRLTTPLVRRGGALVAASWDEAMDLVVKNAKDVIQTYSPSAVGFYNTGQLFIEDYYTLGIVAKAGVGTSHVDGNTRLCTATAARAMIESFGSDGQPGSYSDIDVADTLLLCGHNIASQQTVLWARILDRLAGPKPPKLVVIDPRTTESARHAAVHLTPRVGTNVPVMNGLLHLIIEAGHIAPGFIEAHTVGFDELRRVVSEYTPDRVYDLAGIHPTKLREAADVLGNAKRLTSTVLQGFYQSNQASAASVQVNNLQLIRGMIGRPGCGVLQMNGQPTAENTRECGCDGEMPAFRNWQNEDHIDELARLWNVEPGRIRHWGAPTHAMQIFRYAEAGSIKFLWIIATNPAVSMPDLPRIREILGKHGLFLVVQDAWMTETAEYADVVLPAAIWGEKTGTFTNADRTVHLSLKAVEPPGAAKSDMDIFLDFARRMDFRDRDGAPLIKWSDPEGAFEAWKACSKGRPCDYSGMSYAKLAGGSGIQWPCNDEFPDGCPRLYADGVFPSRPDQVTDYGHDLLTGAAVPGQEYRAKDPGGCAILKAAEYAPPFEEPDDDYPLWLTTGRVVYHFHTRTKTGRSKDLQDAAPDAFVQISAEDAKRLGVADGDMVEVESRRGSLRAPAKVGDILPGHLFIPFHYGYWDDDGRPRAANELTLPGYDPVSKQPFFKYAAVRAKKATALDRAGDAAAAAVQGVKAAAKKARDAAYQVATGGGRPHLGDALNIIFDAERALADAIDQVADRHAKEPDTKPILHTLSAWSRKHMEQLEPVQARHPAPSRREPERIEAALFRGDRAGGFGLLRDLQDLWLLANEVHIGWQAVRQAAQALNDAELESLCEAAEADNHRQIAWLRTRINQAAPQALVVPS